MQRPNTQIPNLHLQSPTVDFIENRLDKHHPAFSTPPSHFDPALGSFIVDDVEAETSGPATSRVGLALPEQPPDTLNTPVPIERGDLVVRHASISPRPSPKPLEALDFWASYFPQAMKQFIEAHPFEPEQLVKSGQSIRDKNDWTQVFDQLEAARNEYSKVDNKFKAGFRTVHRKFGDHAADPLHRLTKLIPGGGELGSAAVTPIVGCVQILLEVSRRSNSYRRQCTGALYSESTTGADSTFPTKGSESCSQRPQDHAVCLRRSRHHIRRHRALLADVPRRRKHPEGFCHSDRQHVVRS